MERRATAAAAGLGAGLGAIAAAVQAATLPWGAIAADQWLPFGAAFVLAGLVSTVLLALVLRFLARRSTRVSLAGAGLLVAVALALLLPRNVRERPAVLFLVTDTTRADHLSLHGYERDTTPFLRELAARSVVFDRSYSQGSHTIVSTPSIVASCYPSEHGLDSYSDVLSPDHVLISEVLVEAGWYTCGVVTNPHVSARNGFDQGFVTYELFGRGNAAIVHADSVNARFLNKLDFHRPAWEQGKQTKGAPLFGFVFYTDPHAPYVSPPAYRDLWLPEGSDSTDWLFKWQPDSVQAADEPWVARLVAQYDATITYWDDAFRRLAEELDGRGEWDNALIVYTSDHGEEFYEHGKYGHGHALWEELLRVPLLVSLPVPVRFPPLPRTSRRSDLLVSSVDILPTVLAYLRLPVPAGASGRSVLPAALGGAAGPDRAVFLEEILETYQRYDLRGVRDGPWKYLVHHRGDGPEMERFLFDLAGDPGEQENRIDSEPAIVDRLSELLLEHTRRATENAPRPGQMEPDAEHMRQLEALGYLD